MWVKICANTNLRDALMAVESGADALGFVFAESKRHVTPSQVVSITPHIPLGIERVGVFSSREAAEIVSIAQDAGLNAVQLHGGLDLDLAARVKDLTAGRLIVLQTLHWVVGGDSGAEVAAQLLQIAHSGVIDRVLIDSRVGGVGGGTGVSFDWNAAREVLLERANGLKVIVAGGLKPDNVAEAIRKLSPWGVDVASGVEAAPGTKDPEKVRSFLMNAKQQT